MTYEEAMNVLRRDRELCMFNPMTGECEPMNEESMVSAEAMTVAIEALEKQIPKKPYMEIEHLEDGCTYYHCDCPSCNMYLTGHKDRYPHHCECGQAIDWSDTE